MKHIPSMIIILAGVCKSLVELLVILGATTATSFASSGKFGWVFAGFGTDETLDCKIMVII